MFYDGSNYTILTDGGNNSTSLFKSLGNDFVIFGKVNVKSETNSPIEITKLEYTEFQSFKIINLKTDELLSLSTNSKDKNTETNYLTEKYEENALGNIKCKTSSSESAFNNLCTSCNIEKEYFPVQFPKEEFLHGFT